MKAPDKIYLPVFASSLLHRDVIENHWMEVQSPFAKENVEYIRKDALLEWAEEQMRIHENRILEAAITNTAKIGASISGIKRDMYKVFIDKLNAL